MCRASVPILAIMRFCSWWCICCNESMRRSVTSCIGRWIDAVSSLPSTLSEACCFASLTKEFSERIANSLFL